MSTNFEFNAPQFINFSEIEDPKADKFFDLQQEQKKVDFENRDPRLLTKNGISSYKKTFSSLKKVLHEIVNQQIQNDVKTEPLIPNQAKDLVQNFEKLQLSKSKTIKQKVPLKATKLFDSLPNKGSSRKSHQMITRQDAINIKMETKPSAKQSLSYEDISSTSSINPPQGTKIKPFSFDEKMKATLQKKVDFIRKVIEEDKKKFNSFRAHPMPSFKNKYDPSNKKQSHKTVPQPFNLTQVKGTRSISEENIAAIKITPFKAKPADVVYQKPFIPKLGKRKVIPPSNFHLNTEIRAVERQKFDEKIKQKEKEYGLMLEQEKEEEERLEIAKMLEYRKKTEFKARPMPHYKVFEIQGSDITKITFPQSPYLRTKLRLAQKQNHSNDVY